MQPENPESYSASAKATWPTTAIPGQPGAHLRAAQADGADPDLSDEAPVHSADKADAASGLEEIPDAEPTVGSALLDELRAQIAQFVILPSPEALDAVTLWVAATHLQPAWQHAPRLAVVGPAKRCGKSRLLDVLTETVHDPMLTINTTPAAIFRSITEENPPTLLVDEADTIFGTPKMAEKNEEMRGLLNAGHQRNRYVTRVVGNDHTPHRFATFAMAAIAGIGDLPDTIMDRAVVIRMRRRAQGEKVKPFRSRRDIPALHELRDRIAAWARPLLDETANLPLSEDRRRTHIFRAQVLRQLNRIGVNVNQIARALNSDHTPPDIRQRLTELHDLLELIAEALRQPADPETEAAA